MQWLLNFSTGYKEYVIKVYCYVKWICRSRNHFLFTVTPIYPIFHPQKIFLLVVAASPDSITKGRVFDKGCISLSSDSCWFSKRHRKVSLNKEMLKCKTFTPTLNKLTRTCRRVLLGRHPNLPVHTGFDSFIWTLSFYRLNSHELTRPSRRFFLSIVTYTDQTIHMDIFLPLT